ncbi:hypothetical protein CHS0354_013590 [Potamilus streckersoni]|uniref:Uncharacterized protein n=1 Tax=Potamilus streckersoni TaxID=2493646 RepID=A0AAE0SKR2_9BIVA|nr:hypothetical protein CHS0354_013590 [Potamilus streckersoni]
MKKTADSRLVQVIEASKDYDDTYYEQVNVCIGELLENKEDVNEGETMFGVFYSERTQKLDITEIPLTRKLTMATLTVTLVSFSNGGVKYEWKQWIQIKTERNKTYGPLQMHGDSIKTSNG